MAWQWNPITNNLDIVGSSGGGSPTPVLKYYATFNATTDWGSASGGYYTITVLAATHAVGVNPIIELFENIAGVFHDVTPDELTVNASGDIAFRVPASPDLRFQGKITVV